MMASSTVSQKNDGMCIKFPKMILGVRYEVEFAKNADMEAPGDL
jgi:hypothetical protein